MNKASMLKNCPVKIEDVERAYDIFGKDIPTLKGKTVRRKPRRVRHEFIKGPKYVLDKNKDMDVEIDILVVTFC